MRHVRSVLLRLAGIALAIACWHLITLGNGRSDIPGPWLAVSALGELVTQGVLWRFAVASVFRVVWGFFLAAAIGIPLGLALGKYALSYKMFNPLIQALRPISPIAWLPIAVLMFGGSKWWEPSDLSAIFLIFLASFFPIVTATTSAVRTIDKKYLQVSQNFGLSGLDSFRLVGLPAALPGILTGLRLAMGIAWVVVVAAEMLGVQSGLGFQINDARNNLRYDIVGAAMIMISIIGMLLDYMVAHIERTVMLQRGTTSQAQSAGA